MSMSTYVVGFAPPDETWRVHKAVWDACTAANVPVPNETSAFFGHEQPDEAGVNVNLSKLVRKYNDSYRCQDGIEIDLASLPPNVKIIRFVNSY